MPDAVRDAFDREERSAAVTSQDALAVDDNAKQQSPSLDDENGNSTRHDDNSLRHDGNSPRHDDSGPRNHERNLLDDGNSPRDDDSSPRDK